MSALPEIATTIRHTSPVQLAQGGRIEEVVLVLTNGHRFSFFELRLAGQVLVGETLAELTAIAAPRR